MIYTIENDKLLIKVASLGATLVSFIDKESNKDIVLGFENENDYLNNRGPYFGTTIARYANRIGNGTFCLNGATYHTPINNNGNTLHGGEGLSFKEFELKDKNSSSVTFVINSLDGEDGFPGNLKLYVKYELNDNCLFISYKAICDKDSVLNITNHSYFNLNGVASNALDQELKIFTDEVALLDENGMSKEETIDVNGTSYDFIDYRLISENIKLNHNNLSGGGIDHNFVFESLNPKQLVSLRNDQFELNVYSDLPDCQIYTGNFLGDLIGKNNQKYHNYYGVAIEPQYYPNAINYDKYIKPIIKANEEVTHFIKYELNGRDK